MGCGILKCIECSKVRATTQTFAPSSKCSNVSTFIYPLVLTCLLQFGGHFIGHLLGELGGRRGIGEGHTWDHRGHTRGVQRHGRGHRLKEQEQTENYEHISNRRLCTIVRALAYMRQTIIYTHIQWTQKAYTVVYECSAGLGLLQLSL